jgi:aspartate--ammonia ligase
MVLPIPTGRGLKITPFRKLISKCQSLDHDHSAYVDQWDWERVITKDMRNLKFLRDVVEKIWGVIYEAGQMVKKDFPGLNTDKYPDFPKKLEFFHAEDILCMGSTATSWYGTP